MKRTMKLGLVFTFLTAGCSIAYAGNEEFFQKPVTMLEGQFAANGERLVRAHDGSIHQIPNAASVSYYNPIDMAARPFKQGEGESSDNNESEGK